MKKSEEVVACLSDFLFKRGQSCDALALQRHLEVTGWCLCVNQGQHSVTLVSPCGACVVRIGMRKDDAYSAHAVTAILNPDNAYFQNVYWHVVLYDFNFTLTLMERLYDVDCSRLCVKMDRSYLFEALPFKHLSIRDWYFSRLPTEAQQAILKIEDLNYRFKYLSDINFDNIMMRENGELVIIDSVFNPFILSWKNLAHKLYDWDSRPDRSEFPA